MNRKVSLSLTFSLITVLLIFCGIKKYNEPMPDSELGKYQACEEDADCVYANNGCCDCANGGIEVAVNSDLLDEFIAGFDCTGVACTEIAPAEPCGTNKHVSCDDGKCNLIGM